MTKIEEIEKSLKEWKAAKAEREEDGHTKVVIEYKGIIRGLTIALQILDQPPNQVVDDDHTECTHYDNCTKIKIGLDCVGCDEYAPVT